MNISRMRSTPRFIPPALALAVFLLACERSRTPAPPDTSRPAPAESTEAVAPVPPPPAWDASAGPVMLARNGSATAALVVFPQYADSTLPDTVRFDVGGIRNLSVDLLGRSGAVGTATVASVQPKQWSGDECIEWPRAQLRPTSDSTAAGWSVAFVHGRVQPVALDSIESLARPDSARLAADVTRLASMLPDDTSRTFQGIPFAVRSAYRFPVANGVQGVVADVVRRLNQEANPLEQHTLLVAERSAADPQARFHTVFHERSAGSEETLETSDVLAVLRYGSPVRTAIVLLREGLETSAYELLERDPSGHWRQRWVSVHTGC